MPQAPIYIVNGDMSANIAGGEIAISSQGRLRAEISWVSTGSPVGTLALEYKNLAGVWKTVPDASAQFTTQPNSNAGDLTCYWRELQGYADTVLRITYTRSSGGTSSSLLQVRTSMT